VTGSDDGGTRGTASTLALIDQFPLLHAARRRENAAVAQGRMLALAGLTETWLARFKAALQQRTSSDKMTGAAAQSDLIDIFATKIEDRGGEVHLKPEHVAALKAQWRDDPEEVFAFRLLCMAALYTNYSSSRIFGYEQESPNALRAYAEALLRKAEGLAPGLLDNKLKDWVGKLRGKGRLFQCTAILYGIQSDRMAVLLGQEAATGPLHQVRDAMIPVIWREGRAV
jgi:hypothetical protein